MRTYRIRSLASTQVILTAVLGNILALTGCNSVTFTPSTGSGFGLVSGTGQPAVHPSWLVDRRQKTNLRIDRFPC